MRAGKLDRLIEIQRPVTSTGEYGTPTTTWLPFAMIRAQLLQNSMDDREGGPGHRTDTSLGFRVRWLDGITLEHRVVYNGQPYQIRSIKELGRRVGLDLACEKVGP